MVVRGMRVVGVGRVGVGCVAVFLNNGNSGNSVISRAEDVRVYARGDSSWVGDAFALQIPPGAAQGTAQEHAVLAHSTGPGARFMCENADVFGLIAAVPGGRELLAG